MNSGIYFVRPGEVFSFCKTVGLPTRYRGYRSFVLVKQDQELDKKINQNV